MLAEKTRGDGRFADQSVTSAPGRTLTHTGGMVLEETVKQKKKKKKIRSTYVQATTPYPLCEQSLTSGLLASRSTSLGPEDL